MELENLYERCLEKVFGLPQGFLKLHDDYRRDIRARVLKVTLDPRSRQDLASERKETWLEICLALRSMEPQKKADYIRRTSAGVDFAMLMENPFEEAIRRGIQQGIERKRNEGDSEST